MLKKCSSALLLTEVSSFADMYKNLASDMDIRLTVVNEWSSRYRVSEDVIILSAKYLDSLNRSYYPEAVLILKEGENPGPYIEKGITRFIFNYKNKYELLCAFYKTEKILLHSSSVNLKSILKESKTVTYTFGDYDFNFATNRFMYKGRLIYFTDSVKSYMAEWLLNGNKDNSKRMILCNLRKKLGKDFMKDIDRYGRTGGTNEQ